MLKRIRQLFGAGKSDPPDSAAHRADDAALQGANPEATAPIVHHFPAVVHRPIDENDLDPDAVRIVRRLTRFDHTAYLVGGCVRDLLLGRRPKDFDIGTSATPRQVKRLFSNSRIIGRRFRLAHIYFQSGKIIEVATFRARDLQEEVDEPEGQDVMIREDNVFGTPEEDAVRRDFTINALFYDLTSGTVLDHAGGLEDLRRGLIRTIGDPALRFREDPVRILRAIKFAARLGFQIEPATLEAVRRTRSAIAMAAPPRVLEEINRFCRGGSARASFDLLFDTEVFDDVLPELAPTYRDASARAVLAALLEAIDRRHGQGREIHTGEIFSALVLPVLAPALGWGRDGTVAARPGLLVRDLANDTLRPIALRLRISRRDQERCRQAMATLHRLVPARAMRRGQRGALSRRPSFEDALWMLEALAGHWGGEFAASYETWRTAGAGEPVAPTGMEPTRQGDEERVPGGRRRRRGGRGRRKGPVAAEAPAALPPAAPPPQTRVAGQRGGRDRRPAVWDDDYFFAALPSVPQIQGEERDTDRYGARAVAPDEDRAPADRSAGPDSPDSTVGRGGAPGRRRRRRGRGRRSRPGSGEGPGSPPQDGSS